MNMLPLTVNSGFKNLTVIHLLALSDVKCSSSAKSWKMHLVQVSWLARRNVRCITPLHLSYTLDYNNFGLFIWNTTIEIELNMLCETLLVIAKSLLPRHSSSLEVDSSCAQADSASKCSNNSNNMWIEKASRLKISSTHYRLLVSHFNEYDIMSWGYLLRSNLLAN